LSFLSRKSGSFLGVDIGSSAVKCVELVGTVSSPKVKSWGIEALESGTIEEGSIVKQDDVISAIDSLLKRCRTKTKNVAVAVSSAHAITKVISMPNDLTERDIEDQVEMEAAHFVPYAIDDVNLDFSVLGPSPHNPDGEQDVLIAACRTDIIDDYVSVIQEVGLQPSVVDIDTYAIERLYMNQRGLRASKKDSKATAVFDIGVNSTKLVVFQGDEAIFNRQQKFGGSQLINLVRQEYGLSAQEALAIIESESPPSDINEKVYKPFLSTTSSELARALQFFYSSSKHKEVSKVLFTGGVSGLPQFAKELGSIMNVKADNLIDFSKFSVQGNKNVLVNKIGRLSVATGLAMRGLEN
jgi:type IV pilus assembly protein PilM